MTPTSPSPERGPDLSYAALSAWVAPMADEEVCGYSRAETRCPLARLAKAQGFVKPSIGRIRAMWWERVPSGGAVLDRLDHARFPLAFVHYLDQEMQQTRSPKKITAADVRRILADLAGQFGGAS